MTKAHFIGDVVTKWLDDGRTMELVEPFVFVGSGGERWECNVGDKTDGSSIPWFAWTIIAMSPYVGKHRKAAVPHDIECRLKRKPYQRVHLMYYKASRTAGLSKLRARMMYKAILVGGPKW